MTAHFCIPLPGWERRRRSAEAVTPKHKIRQGEKKQGGAEEGEEVSKLRNRYVRAIHLTLLVKKKAASRVSLRSGTCEEDKA